jgi:hypothetical protein
MVTMLASMLLLASALSLQAKDEPVRLPASYLQDDPESDEPIDTQTVVSLDDYKHYDNCETPGECSAPCTNPQVFHLRMCDSWMCQYCSSDYCAEECKGVQEEYPTCRCKSWPEHKKSYSASDLPPPPPYAFHHEAVCPPGTEHVLDESECLETITDGLNMRNGGVNRREDRHIGKGCWAVSSGGGRGPRVYYNPYDVYAGDKKDFHRPETFGVLCKSA